MDGVAAPVDGRRGRIDLLLAVVTWAVVAFGAAVRIRAWWAGRSFWLDEVSLASATVGRSYAALAHPLTRGQAAPVGWLWTEHTVALAVGFGERTMRMLPLFFGCAGLVLVALLARRVLSPPAAGRDRAGGGVADVGVFLQ